MQKLLSLLSNAVGMKDSHILVIGDFNYGTIDWESLQSSESTEHCSSLFVEHIKDLFLYQHVDQDTRFRAGQVPSLLDLLLTNEKMYDS